MTIPSIVKDLLMLEPSFNQSPVAPVEAYLSEPAKSTMLIFEFLMIFFPSFYTVVSL